MADTGTGQVNKGEEIEGIDEAPELGADSKYPLDDVMVRSETRTVRSVVDRIEAGRYVMNPDFQRDFVWPRDKQSKLIESCVMRIPLPVLYVAEAPDGRVTIVDGLQRLSTFRDFLQNRLRLTGLGKGHPLLGQSFDDLPVNLKERIEDTQLTLYILDSKAPEAARLDIFERVNSGLPLTRQQMRNALYDGPGTRWLAQQADSEEFIEATVGGLRSDTMRDREAINRFAAFSLLGWEHYPGGDMDEFLARVLKKMNHMSEIDLAILGENFRNSMKLNREMFGRHAFRKSLFEDSKAAYRSVLNIALFDVLAVGLSRFPEGMEDAEKDRIRAAVIQLQSMKDPDTQRDFLYCISYSTNSSLQVRGRFACMEHALSGLGK